MGAKAAMKKVAMKAAMKKVAMKKAVSKIAKGKMARSSVFRGSKVKTVGGLTKDKLTKSKSGKIVSKGASVAAKKRYAKSGAKAWAHACKAARKALGFTGFVAIGGKTPKGKALYAKAKAIRAGTA